jgi:hypothetical protein
MRYALWVVIFMLLVFSAGCKKPADNSQTAVENAINKASGGQVSADISKGSTTVTDNKTGQSTTISTSGNGKMPAGWPKEVPQYWRNPAPIPPRASSSCCCWRPPTRWIRCLASTTVS